MRTPHDVFKDMCPVHDQIWTYDGTRWQCIRKSADGQRYTSSDGLVPLPVEEMLTITGLEWVYFCTITGHTEPLISKRQRASLLASRTPEQIQQEELRLSRMMEERNQHADCFVEHIFATHPGAILEYAPEADREVN